MSDMKKMFSVLQAFRVSDDAHRYLRYLDEIEGFITGEVDEEHCSEAISEVREMLLRTHEAALKHVFSWACDKEKCKDSCDIE